MHNDSPASKAKLNFFKLVLLLAGITVALYLSLNQVKFQNKAAQFQATLLLPTTATVAAGSTFQAPISLNTGGGAIRGVDVQITFDKAKLRLTAITPNASSLTTLKTFAPITTANTFDTATVINNANASGNIEFGAVTADLSTSNVTAAYNGSTVLATLTFQGLSAGTTTVSFIPFTVGSINLTTDTNIVTDSNPPTDTLSSVTNMNVTVSGSTFTWSRSDIVVNSKVDIFDYNAMVSDFGCPSRLSPACAANWNIADIIQNGKVDIFDYNAMVSDFGCPSRTSPVCT